jgi:hypothetical protein
LILLVLVASLVGAPALAATSQGVSVTAIPAGFDFDPPDDFVATYVTDTQVDLTWTTGAGATNTMVRAKVGEYPSDRTDGYQVYYGSDEEATDTGLDLDNTLVPVYYRAWSENAGGSWTTDYAQDYVGGTVMALLATTLQGGLFLIPLIVFSILAFWRLNPVLFLIAAAIGLMTGLSIPDLLAGNTSSDLSLSLGLLVVAYGLACVVFAYVTLFRVREADGTA